MIFTQLYLCVRGVITFYKQPKKQEKVLKQQQYLINEKNMK